MAEIMVQIWVTVHGCNPELRDSHCIISFF